METFGHIRMNTDCTNSFSDEWLERTFLEKVGHIDNTKRVAQIRLIGTKLQHCLLVADDRIRRFCDNTSFRCEFFKYCGKHFLSDSKHIFLRCKTHLEIELVKLSR